MKTVGIVGSARRGGNTEILTQIALDEIQKEGIDTIKNFAHNMTWLLKKTHKQPHKRSSP